MEFGVDADGVGEGEWREGCEVADDEVGDVWEVDGVCFEGLQWRAVSSHLWTGGGVKRKALQLSNGRRTVSTAFPRPAAAPLP